MADERIRLLLDMGMSAQEAEKVVVALDGVKRSAQGAAQGYEVLDRVIERSTGIVGTYTVSLGKEDAELDKIVRSALEATQAQKAMNEVLMVTSRGVTNLIGQPGARGGMGGQGLLGASYAIQDFTSVLTGGGGLARALGSVTNNIPSLLMGLGAGTGVTAAVGTLAVAVVAAVPLIEKLWEALSGGKKGPAVVLEAYDAVKAKIKEIEAEFQKIMALKPMQERETAGLVTEFFGENDPARIQRGLAAGLAASGEGARANADEQMRMRTLKAALGGRIDAEINARIQALQIEIQSRINAVNEAAAGELMARATTSPAARRQIARLAGIAPGGFPRGFGAHLGELEPEAVEAQDRAVADAEARGQAMHDRAEKARQKAKKIDALNVQGQQNADLAMAAAEKGIKEDIQLGRRVGRAAQQGRGVALGAGHIAPLPMMQADASEQEIRAVSIQTAQAIAANQLKLANDVQQMKEVYRTLRQVRTRLENNPMPAGNGR